MDDIGQGFGGQRVMKPIEEAWHNEQKRKQYDIIRVKNPVKITIKGNEYNIPAKDFYVMYDVNQFQKVGANSTIDIPRYMAERYVKHKKDEIINFLNQKKHDEQIAERRAKGHPDFTSKYEENQATYTTDAYFRTNDETIVSEIYDQLWLGLVHEYGRDMPPQIVDPRSGEVDLASPETKTLEKLNKRRIAPGEAPAGLYTSVQQEQYRPPAPVDSIPPQPSGFSNLNARLSADEITNDE